MPGIPPIVGYALPSSADLPESIPQWTFDPERAVLLVHDMQLYFLSPFPEPMREELVAAAAALRDQCAKRGVQVAYTAQPGSMTDEQRGLLKDIWGPGMRANGQNQEIVPQLAPADGDWVLTKWRYSAFARTDLLERCRAAGRDQLVLCGVYAHVGVLATALDAYSNDIQPFFVADATADFTEDHHRMALDYAAARCAVVTTAKGLLT
ncbi:isochorismatase family protein [Lentzea tibetensis]|uniref:Isochorismatase family protein n=1 Tax=Lentzea tibetensis TaxID=2591470 RepID=A0A563ESG0_9PSEU|nr:isochorismatase family protein [Lentzea tibetensis]TWP50542.1 isochorismatase family protein [Lentzea tibetensis]